MAGRDAFKDFCFFPLIKSSEIFDFSKKKKRNSERKRCPFLTLFRFGGSRGRPWERLVREIRCPFLRLFRFRGSRGGPLGETPSPSRPTWLSETPRLGVGGGRRGSPSPGANRRIRPKPAGSWAGAPRGGAWNPAPRPPPNSPKIP